MTRYLFYVVNNYAFEILRPLQQEIRNRGDEVAWFVKGEQINTEYFEPDELKLDNIDQAVNYRPTAVFVPGNLVPSFIPGLKVQVFHGFEWKKKGHFRIRGLFDLYCTQGPFFTKKFQQLKSKHPHFNVAETGWPKMDTLFSARGYTWPTQKPSVKTILYAPTFSPSLTSAPALFDEIARLVKQRDWQWLIKFHPKMAESWVARFKTLECENLRIVETASIAPVLQAADVMLSDTSSIITEFALIKRPIVTYNNKAPESHLIDISDAQQLESALDKALIADEELLAQIETNVTQMHPYNDGKSSARILDAVDNMLNNDQGALKSKPFNILRLLKLRKQLSYWKF